MAEQQVAGLQTDPGVGEGLLSGVDRHGGVLGAGGDVLAGQVDTPENVPVLGEDLHCRHGLRAHSGHHQLAVIVTSEQMKFSTREEELHTVDGTELAPVQSLLHGG